MKTNRKNGASIVGIAVAACAACCAVPILGVIAAAGLVTVFTYLAVGVVALLLLVPSGVVVDATPTLRSKLRSGAETQAGHGQIDNPRS